MWWLIANNHLAHCTQIEKNPAPTPWASRVWWMGESIQRSFQWFAAAADGGAMGEHTQTVPTHGHWRPAPENTAAIVESGQCSAQARFRVDLDLKREDSWEQEERNDREVGESKGKYTVAVALAIEHPWERKGTW
jgi:hypothetical protein